MKYRELLQLYKEGKLTETERKEIEEALEKEQALLDFILDQEEVPNFSEEEDVHSDSKKEQTAQREYEMEAHFQKQLQRSIRRAFQKMGMTVGAVLLACLLLIEFVLPHVVDYFYYNPGKTVGKGNEEEDKTNQISLDLAVYSELFLPEYMRDNVSVTERGYGNYDIQIIQNVARPGETFIDVGGKIERNHLTVFDPNILKRPVDNVFEWNMNSMDPSKTLEEQIEQPKELPDGSVEISNMSPGGTPEECRETINQLEEEKYYKAYVTLNQVLPYETMYKFLKQYEIRPDWCAIQCTDQMYQMYHKNIGFSIYQSGNNIAWDKKTYPLLRTVDGEAYDEIEKMMQTEEGACTHFTSMLHYMSKQTRFLKMFYPELEAETLEESAEYVEKNGVKIYGMLITADRAILQKLDDTEEVYSIYVLER